LVPEASERVDSPFVRICDQCSKRDDFNNQIHQSDKEFLKQTRIYVRELEEKGTVWIPKKQSIFSLHKPLNQLLTILSCHNYSTIAIFLTRFNLITTSIDFNNYSILQPNPSVKLLHLLVLIILHQQYIQIRREIQFNCVQGICDPRGIKFQFRDKEGVSIDLRRRDNERRESDGHSITSDGKASKTRSDRS
jgi:hypothetical protein